MFPHVKRIVAGAALVLACVLPGTALSADFTDIWYLPQESGWGVNIVQSDSFLFATFFIYGSNKQPTWYTAELTWDGTRYAGGLYLTQGTYWRNEWNPAEHLPPQRVGTASFQPNAQNAYQATLVYTVDSVGVTVTKPIVRQKLTQIAIGGSYLGAQSGSYGSCNAADANATYVDKFSLGVAQSASGAATLTFSYDTGSTCTLSGTLQQFGQLYDMPGASYACTGQLNFTTTATLYELKATAQGIEGRLSAHLPDSGCQENANFSAVLF
jgi:hypothetical protein